MKALVSGPRGWLLLAVAAVTAVVAMWLLGGCGGGSQGTSVSQLDDKAATGTGSTVSTVKGAGGDVLPGYTQDQCVTDMTKRYGGADIAQKMCNAIKSDYGAGSQTTDLGKILPSEESKLGVTPQAGATIPVVGGSGSGGSSGGNSSGGGSSGGGSSGGNSGGGGSGGGNSGWNSGIEITVPGGP